MKAFPNQIFIGGSNNFFFRPIITAAIALCSLSASAHVRAYIPWPEVVQRLAYENEKLAHRSQGHSGEYFVVCTLYYTPMETRFAFALGFDATAVTHAGLHFS